jgi:hypothetical protein
MLEVRTAPLLHCLCGVECDKISTTVPQGSFSQSQD